MNPTVTMISDWMQFGLTIAAFVTMIYTLSKFMNKPNITQNERIDALEEWKRKIDNRLDIHSEHFEAIDQSNKITQKALLALMSHSLDGNSVTELKEAKAELERYLINK